MAGKLSIVETRILLFESAPLFCGGSFERETHFRKPYFLIHPKNNFGAPLIKIVFRNGSLARSFRHKIGAHFPGGGSGIPTPQYIDLAFKGDISCEPARTERPRGAFHASPLARNGSEGHPCEPARAERLRGVFHASPLARNGSEGHSMRARSHGTAPRGIPCEPARTEWLRGAFSFVKGE